MFLWIWMGSYCNATHSSVVWWTHFQFHFISLRYHLHFLYSPGNRSSSPGRWHWFSVSFVCAHEWIMRTMDGSYGSWVHILCCWQVPTGIPSTELKGKQKNSVDGLDSDFSPLAISLIFSGKTYVSGWVGGIQNDPPTSLSASRFFLPCIRFFS